MSCPAQIEALATEEGSIRGAAAAYLEALPAAKTQLKDIHLERAVRRIEQRFGRKVFHVLLTVVSVASDRDARNDARRWVRVGRELDGELKIVEIVADREERAEGSWSDSVVFGPPITPTAVVEEDLRQSEVLFNVKSAWASFADV
jgi:hypothetical protein